MPDPAQRLVKIESGLYIRHDFFMHGGHELEVVGPQSARKPEILVGWMPDLVAVLVNHEPIRVRIINVLVTGMRIRPGHDIHAQFAARRGNVPKSVHVSGATCCGNAAALGRVEGDASAALEQAASA